MSPSACTRILAAAVPLALPGCLAAAVFSALLPTLGAQTDVIQWRDGSVTRGVEVEEYNASEIKFKNKGSLESRPAPSVSSVTIDDVQRLVVKTGENPEGLVGEADGIKKAKPFVAQALYWRAVELLLSEDRISEAVSVLEILDNDLPNSAYAPELYRVKLQHYLARNAFEDAAKTAVAFGDASRTRSWSPAYSLEAEYWQKRVAAASGKRKMAQYASDMQDLANRASISAPHVAVMARVDLADAYRGQGDYEQAQAEYERLGEEKSLSPNVLARMHLGLGYVHMEKGVISGMKEAYHKAYNHFLKVYILAPEATADYRAEGLYNAIKAVEQWAGTPNWNYQAAVLRGRLLLHSPYKETEWARRN